MDPEGPGGAETRVFNSSAILLYLAEKEVCFLGSAADRGELLSWLFFIATGLGPFSGQAVHFQRAAPDKLPYAINRSGGRQSDIIGCWTIISQGEPTS